MTVGKGQQNTAFLPRMSVAVYDEQTKSPISWSVAAWWNLQCFCAVEETANIVCPYRGIGCLMYFSSQNDRCVKVTARVTLAAMLLCLVALEVTSLI